jgi:Outer membrane protein beta-barrel domain
MNSLKAVTAGILLAASPALALADDMSYRYFQLGYMQTDIDGTGVSDDLDGFATRGSLGFAENFFVFTEYQDQSVEEDGIDVSLKQIVVGLGGHYGLSENLDLVGRVGYADLTLDIDGAGIESPDESGFMAGGGLRGRIGENVELEGGAVYYDYNDVLDELGFEAIVRFHFNERWALAFEYQDVGDVSTMMGGVRVSF